MRNQLIEYIQGGIKRYPREHTHIDRMARIRNSRAKGYEMAVTKYDFQRELEEELERLKKILKLGYELKVRWIPNINPRIYGEVKGDYIYVYNEDREVALETLKHEFLDCAISKVIEPYKEVTNKLIALINENAYRNKEKLLEVLCNLID